MAAIVDLPPVLADQSDQVQTGLSFNIRNAALTRSEVQRAGGAHGQPARRGRLAWRAFAGSIGAVPVTAVPGRLLAAGAVILVVAGNVLTAAPAAVAASTDPAAALRAE